METMETDASSSASQHEATLPDPRPTASEDGIEVGCLHCEHQEAVTKQQNGPSDPEAECLVTAVPVGNPRQVFAAAVVPCLCVDEVLEQLRKGSDAIEIPVPAESNDWGKGKGLKGLRGMFVVTGSAKDRTTSIRNRTAMPKPAAAAAGTSSAFVFANSGANGSCNSSSGIVAVPTAAQHAESAAGGTVGELRDLTAAAEAADGEAGPAAGAAAVGCAAVFKATPATHPAALTTAVPTTVSATDSAAVLTAAPAAAPITVPAADFAAFPTVVPATVPTADPAIEPAIDSAVVGVAAVPAADSGVVASVATPTAVAATHPAADPAAVIAAVSAAVVTTSTASESATTPPSQSTTRHQQPLSKGTKQLHFPPFQASSDETAANPAAGVPPAAAGLSPAAAPANLDPAAAAAALPPAAAGLATASPAAAGPAAPAAVGPSAAAVVPRWTIKDTPLHAALLQVHDKALEATLLEQHAADIDAIDNTMGWTPLHYAAATHNAAAVEQLLAAGANPAAVAATSGLTPLHLAVIPKQDLSTPAERQSLKNNTTSLYGMQSRLGCTCGKIGRPGCLKIVDMLLAAGADASAAAVLVPGPDGMEVCNHGIYGAQPLHLAACVCITPGKDQAAAAALDSGGTAAAASAAVSGSTAVRSTVTTAAAAAGAGDDLSGAETGVLESSSASVPAAAAGADGAAAAAAAGGTVVVGGGVSSVPTEAEFVQLSNFAHVHRGSYSNSQLWGPCKNPVVDPSTVSSREASSAVAEESKHTIAHMRHRNSSSSSGSGSESMLEECGCTPTASSQAAAAIDTSAVASAAVRRGVAGEGSAAGQLVDGQPPACAEGQSVCKGVCSAAAGGATKLQGADLSQQHQQQQQAGRTVTGLSAAAHAVTDLQQQQRQQQRHIDGAVIRNGVAGAAVERQQQQAETAATAAAAGDVQEAAAASLASQRQQQQQGHEGPADAAVATGVSANGPGSPKISSANVVHSAASAAAVEHQANDQQQQQEQGEDPAAAAGSSAANASKSDSTTLKPPYTRTMEHCSIIAALFDAGADLDAAVFHTNGETPLTLAARNGAAMSVSALTFLSEAGCKGADLDMPRGNDLCRPIDLATCYGHLSTALMLLEEGAHALPDARCIAPPGTTVMTNSLITRLRKSGGSALDPAATVTIIGASGGVVDDNPEDRAPLQLLVSIVNNCFKGDSEDQLALVQRIVDEGFPLDVVHVATGATAVGLAVRLNKIEILHELIAAGADVNIPWTKGVASSLGGRYDSAGMTPVFDAVRLGRTEMVDVLIAAGADLNSCTDPGPKMHNYNIVQAAANAGCLDMVLKLVEAGAHWRLGKGQSQVHSVPNILALKTNSMQASHIEWRLKLIEKRAKQHKAMTHPMVANPTPAVAAAAADSSSTAAPAVLRPPRELASSSGAATPGAATAAAAAGSSQTSDVDALMAELGLDESEEPKQQISKKALKALARKCQQQQQQQNERPGGTEGNDADLATAVVHQHPCGNTAATEASSSRLQQQQVDTHQPDSPAAASSSSRCLGDHDDSSDADIGVGDLEAWLCSTRGKNHQQQQQQQQQQQHRQCSSTAIGAQQKLQVDDKHLQQQQQQHPQQQQQQNVYKSRQAPRQYIKQQGPGIVRVVPRPAPLSAAAAAAKTGRSSAQQQQRHYGPLDTSAATCSRSVTGNNSAMTWEDLTRDSVDPWAPIAAAAAAAAVETVETAWLAAPTVATPPLTPKLAVSQRSSGTLTPGSAAAAAALSTAAAAASSAVLESSRPGVDPQHICSPWASSSSPLAAAVSWSYIVDLQGLAISAPQPHQDCSSTSPPPAAAAAAGQSWTPSDLPDAMREMLMMPPLPAAATAAAESLGSASASELAASESELDLLQGLIDDLKPADAGSAAWPVAAAAAETAAVITAAGAAAPAAASSAAAATVVNATIMSSSASSSGNDTALEATPAVSDSSQVLTSAHGGNLHLVPIQGSSHLSSPSSNSSSSSNCSIDSLALLKHQAVISAPLQSPTARAAAPLMQLTPAQAFDCQAAPAVPAAAAAAPAAGVAPPAAAARLPPHLLGRHPSTACHPPPPPPPAAAAAAAAAEPSKSAALQLSQLLPLQLRHFRTAGIATSPTIPSTGTPASPALQGLTSISTILQPAAPPLVSAPPLPAKYTLDHVAAAAGPAPYAAVQQQQQQQQGGPCLQQQQPQQQQQQQSGSSLQHQQQHHQQQQQQGGTGLQQWKGSLPPSLMFALGRQSSSGGSVQAAAAAAPRRSSSSSSSSSSNTIAKASHEEAASSFDPKPQPQPINVCSSSVDSHDTSYHPGAATCHPPIHVASPTAGQTIAEPASRINALPSWLQAGAKAAQVSTSAMLRAQPQPTKAQQVLPTQPQLAPTHHRVFQPETPSATSTPDCEIVLPAKLELRRAVVDPSTTISSGTVLTEQSNLCKHELPVGKLGPEVDSVDSSSEPGSNVEADALSISSSSAATIAPDPPQAEVDLLEAQNVCVSTKEEKSPQPPDTKSVPTPSGKLEFELLAARLEAQARELAAAAIEEYARSKAASGGAPRVAQSVAQSAPADLSRTSSATSSDSVIDPCDDPDDVDAQYAVDAAIQGLIHGQRLAYVPPPPPPRRHSKGRYTAMGFGGCPPPGAQQTGVGSGSAGAYRPSGVGGARSMPSRPSHQTLPRHAPQWQHRGRGGASSNGLQGKQQPYPHDGARHVVKVVPRPYQPLQDTSTATPSSSSGFVFSGLQNPVGGRKWQRRAAPRDDVTQLQTVELLSHAAKSLMPGKRKYNDQFDDVRDGGPQLDW